MPHTIGSGTKVKMCVIACRCILYHMLHMNDMYVCMCYILVYI
jgi:hypothetical protein